MTFARRRNRLTTHFPERIPVVKRRISALAPLSVPPTLTTPLSPLSHREDPEMYLVTSNEQTPANIIISV